MPTHNRSRLLSSVFASLLLGGCLLLTAPLGAEESADRSPRSGIQAAEVIRPEGSYALVLLDFDVPAAEAVGPLWPQWRYVGSLRNGRLTIDHGLGLRKPGGVLTLKDGKLTGSFVHNRQTQRKDSHTAKISVNARLEGDQLSGTVRIDGHEGQVTGRVIREEELARRNALSAAASWPRFLGPLGTGGAAKPSGVSLVDEPENAALVWKSEETDIGHGIGAISRFMHTWEHASATRTGSGSSSPILADGKVFLSYYVPSSARENSEGLARLAEEAGIAVAEIPDDAREKTDLACDDIVLAMDAATGKTLWKAVMKARGTNHQHHKEGPFNLSPAYADGRVFAIGMSGYLYALDAETGQPLWETPLGTGRQLWSASVTAVPGVVIAPTEGVWCGFDPATGQRLWTSEIRFTNAAVALWEHQGKHYVVSGSGGNLVWDGKAEDIVCLDAISGQEVWRQALPNAPAVVFSSGRGSGPGGISIHGDHMLAYLLHVSPEAEGRTERRETAKQSVIAWRLSLAGVEPLWRVEGQDLTNGEHVPVVVRDRFVVLGDLRVIDLSSGKTVSQGSGIRPQNGGYLQAMNDTLFVRRDGTHGKIETAVYTVDEAGQIRDLLDGELWRPSLGGSTTSYHHPIYYPMAEGRVFLRQSNGVYCWDWRAGQD